MNLNPPIEGDREFDEQTLTFRCQAGHDHAKLEKLCPKDQVRVFTGRWVSENEFRIEPAKPKEAAVKANPPALDQELARVAALKDDELETLAAELEVKWNKQASRDTMVRKIAEAALARAAKK